MTSRRDHKGRFLPSKRVLNVVPLMGNEASGIDRALRQARQANYKEIVILGLDANGELNLISGDIKNTMDERDTVYLIEVARANLMRGEE